MNNTNVSVPCPDLSNSNIMHNPDNIYQARTDWFDNNSSETNFLTDPNFLPNGTSADLIYQSETIPTFLVESPFDQVHKGDINTQDCPEPDVNNAFPYQSFETNNATRENPDDKMQINTDVNIEDSTNDNVDDTEALTELPMPLLYNIISPRGIYRILRLFMICHLVLIW